jgi:hypothetical protein
MYLLKYRGKQLFHEEICDYQSLTPDKELDVKRDKYLVKKLFGKLKRSSVSKAEKIRRILFSSWVTRHSSHLKMCFTASSGGLSRCWTVRRSRQRI